MTNTIPNVPRELLERVLNAGWGSETVNALDDLRDFLESAPSPAGVDGLKVVGYVSQDDIKWQGDCTLRLKPYSDYTIPLCRLSDAQAIIDGLRGEVEEERAKVAQLEEGIPRIMEASYQFRQQRDQLAGFLLAASKASSAAEVGLIVDTALAELPQ